MSTLLPLSVDSKAPIEPNALFDKAFSSPWASWDTLLNHMAHPFVIP